MLKFQRSTGRQSRKKHTNHQGRVRIMVMLLNAAGKPMKGNLVRHIGVASGTVTQVADAIEERLFA